MIARKMFAGLALFSLASCGGAAKKTPPQGLTEQEAETRRAACAFTPGMLASETIPAGTPVGQDIPIEHIVLIMQENRSFDHYFSELDLPGLDVASRTITNPDSKGNPVQRFHFMKKCMGGGDHGWDAEHKNLDDGKLDGFVKSNNDSTTPMGYYDGTDLPYYYALAKTFAFSDRHFSSALAPTWPNRMFFMAGTSWGLTNNVSAPPYGPSGENYPNLFTELDDAKVSWRVYSQDYPTPLILPHTYDTDPQNFRPQEQFVTDLANGDLASITLVEGSDVKGVLSPDEGPPGDVDLGQQFTGNIIGPVMKSPFWKNTVIFFTYDENGGMYDHVVPPAACPPDNLPPNNGGTVGFNQYGFRVPFFVISPYAKRGYVSHQVTDHTSILRFIEARYGLPAMTGRDANAAIPYDMFDFAHPDFSVPDLPAQNVDQDALKACMGG